MQKSRLTMRQERRKHQVPSVAIAGYTNAGKSSLLNRLTGAGVLVENALFATLDPTVRSATASDGSVYTLVDTVGFVRHLPHQLVEAFKSTLEEVVEADLIVHVVDGSHIDPLGQIDAVRQVLDEIGAVSIPELIVINKADIASDERVSEINRRETSILVSAQTGQGIDELRNRIEQLLPSRRESIDLVIPYSRGDLLHLIYEHGEIIHESFVDEGTHILGRVDVAVAERVKKSLVN